MAKAPTYSVVVPVHNTGRYLVDLLACLERQTVGMDDLQVVLVNDGSTDDSAQVIDAFVATWPEHAVAVHQENAGVSAARNAGIALATAPWIAFPDSDDVLGDGYFEAVTTSRESAPGVRVFATNLLVWEESTGKTLDTHPLRRKFTRSGSVVDLDYSPEIVQMSAASSVIDREFLEKTGVLFDSRVVPRFEDPHFLGRYLLQCERPLVAAVTDAHYLYRRRDDGTSAMQTSLNDERIFTDVPKYGSIDLLDHGARARGGRVPDWLQNMVLYDLFWLFRGDQAVHTGLAQISPEASRVFHEHVRTITGYLDHSTIYAFDAIAVAWWMREALDFGYREEASHSRFIEYGPVDEDREIVALSYRYTGERPDEELLFRGEHVQPRYAKTRELWALGRVVMHERILWVSTRGRVQLRLDGVAQQFYPIGENHRRFRLRPFELRELAEVQGDLRAARRRPARAVTAEDDEPVSRGDRLALWLSRRRLVRRLFGRAWVLMDRDLDADDSAEVLYRWLRENKKDVNAYYVQNRASVDWDRLSKDRSVRLLRYGSLRWKLALLNADHLVSSHIDKFVVEPLDRKVFGPPRWKFTFLQHGVIKGDLSRWLNPKHVDVFVTSTQDEYDYIAGESPYRFSSREVRLTGLPRFDDLLAVAGRVKEQDLLLVMPTWRSYLSTPRVVLDDEAEHNDAFMDSTYAQGWRQLLTDERLHALAAEHGLTIGFMPHPNTQPYLDDFDLPDTVKVLRYGTDDVREVIARSKVMVTDYSSTAFNMAYLLRPVVYYQFDRDEYFSGAHTERPGYFSYESHGFGPVALEAGDALDAVGDVLERGAATPEHLARMERTFPVRDGRNSERVHQAIVATGQRLSLEKARTAAPLDSWDASGARRR
ncbi:CDP-glycerol glycerophosphotransferase family protein [Aeromicrobium sp. IC_218]|uniref:CDP-glycerol glycerophosphotransferase family protein n=1 Tax=Aeromicrobium sp. IC_218 TaxID=2545468 RepID=UPI00104032FE|nr:CDP-glycerol glycerophosphotransferase family protein [Aeromicrobium sp. IC_218]TCI97377.1 glycosyltransferase [Aeromicrobium sp. IC_218]